MRRAIWIALVTMGCAGAGDSGDDGTGDGPLDSNPWDVAVDTNECEEVEGYTVPGAVSWLVHEYELHGDYATGTFTWALYANEAWKDTGEDDCLIVWDADGGIVEPDSDCTYCDFALDLSLTLNSAETTCPEALWSSYQTTSDFIDVDIRDDGSAQFVWADLTSDEGAGNNSEVWAVIGPQCKWF